MKPFISIIIPVYNNDKYINRCLDSLINQTYTNFEIIIIDDGSTDNSYKKIRLYADKYNFIRFFRNKNLGVSYTRNFGLHKATGDYVTFIDSDDWVDSNYLESFLDIQEEYVGDIVMQGILYDWDNQKQSIHYKYDNRIIEKKDFSKNIPRYKILHDGCPVAKLYKKEIIKKYNLSFNENISMHEDHIFVFDFLQYVENLVLSSNIGYHYYRNNVNSLSRKIHTPEKLIVASDLLIEKIDFLCKKFNCNNNNKYLVDLYTHYGLGQKLRAVFNMYKLNYNRNYIKENVSYIKEKNGLLYRKYYRCTSITRLIYFYSFMYFPFFLFDLLNNIIVKKDRL